MKVIVRVPGFFAGTWYKAGETEMHEKIAKRFLPPHGDQLEAVDVVKPDEKPEPKASEAKPADTKKIR